MRALVLDDVVGMHRPYTRILGALGYEVTCATDGEAGLDALTAQPYDLIVTDYEMPKLDGYGFLEALHAPHDTTPVIVCTARDVNHDLIQQFSKYTNVKSVLQKPFDLKAFELAVEATRR